MEENMLTRVAIGLLAGTLLSAPALAQTSTSPSTAPSGSTTAPAAPAQGSQMNQGSGAAMQGGNIQYITQGRPDMWRASQLDGVDVYNQNNERIGEVDDVLVDKSGKVEAVVIGVGGFLGIGERNVAVPFNALQWQMQDQATASNAGTTSTGGAGMGAGGTTGASGTATAPATTGAVGAGGANQNANANANNNNDSAPARAILANATKDQLKQAPEFKYSR
jgi:sporulation protein YlmC with PRC-barrel domain